MKKRFLYLAVVVLSIALLSGCGTSKYKVNLRTVERANEEIEWFLEKEDYKEADEKEKMIILRRMVSVMIEDKLVDASTVEYSEELGTISFGYKGGGYIAIDTKPLQEVDIPVSSPESEAMDISKDLMILEKVIAIEKGASAVVRPDEAPVKSDLKGEWSQEKDPVVEVVMMDPDESLPEISVDEEGELVIGTPTIEDTIEEPSIEGPMEEAGESSTEMPSIEMPSESVITVEKKELKTVVFNSFEDNAYRNANYDYLISKWKNEDFNDLTRIDTVKVETLLTATDYNFVSLSAHGSYYYDEKAGWAPRILLLDDAATAERNKELQKFLATGEVVLAYSDAFGFFYTVTPYFFQNNFSKDSFKDTIVYSESCEFLGKCKGSDLCEREDGHYCHEGTTMFADTFLALGAPAVMGFHNSVSANYALMGLKGAGIVLHDGQTPQMAYKVIIEALGLTDAAYKSSGVPAFLMLYGNNINWTIDDLVDREKENLVAEDVPTIPVIYDEPGYEEDIIYDESEEMIEIEEKTELTLEEQLDYIVKDTNQLGIGFNYVKGGQGFFEEYGIKIDEKYIATYKGLLPDSDLYDEEEYCLIVFPDVEEIVDFATDIYNVYTSNGYYTWDDNWEAILNRKYDENMRNVENGNPGFIGYLQIDTDAYTICVKLDVGYWFYYGNWYYCVTMTRGVRLN